MFGFLLAISLLLLAFGWVVLLLAAALAAAFLVGALRAGRFGADFLFDDFFADLAMRSP
jgi:hypothetical protein